MGFLLELLSASLSVLQSLSFLLKRGGEYVFNFKHFTEEDEIQIFTSPWVNGTRAESYFGGTETDAFIEYGNGLEEIILKGINEVIEKMKVKARGLKANSVVGFDLQIDPYKEINGVKGMYFIAQGTIAKLVPLWGNYGKKNA